MRSLKKRFTEKLKLDFRTMKSFYDMEVNREHNFDGLSYQALYAQVVNPERPLNLEWERSIKEYLGEV